MCLPFVARPARLPRAAVACLLSALLVACGGGGGGDPAPAPAPNVGPAGATLASSDGAATLSVPANAVGSAISVSLQSTSSGFAADPLIVPGTTYELTAPDTALAQGASLQLAVPSSALAEGSAGGTRALPLTTQAFDQRLVNCDVPLTAGVKPPAGTTCFYSRTELDALPPGSNCGYPATLDLGHVTAVAASYPRFGGGTYTGRVELCQVVASPLPQVGSLGGSAPVPLPSTFSPGAGTVTGTIGALGHGVFGVLLDKVKPVVTLSTSIAPDGAGNGRLTISGTTSDNVRVVKAVLNRVDVTGAAPPALASLQYVPIVQFAPGAFTWTSPPLPLATLAVQHYVVSATDAAGNTGSAWTSLAPGVPTIASFAAVPASVPFGGGDTTLQWSASVGLGGTLSISPGIGDVTGLSSKAVTVSAPTTYTLTATNAAGTITATASVAVGAQPAPAILAFTATPAALPAGGGNVTLDWQASNATSYTLDNVAVTGNSKVVNVAATHTFTLQAFNGSGSDTRTVNVTVAANGDRFVSPTGTDNAGCALANPCRNIGFALDTAPAGATVWLADGIYSNANQSPTTFSLPGGVTLKAQHATAATLLNLNLNVVGSGAVNGVAFDGTSTLVAAGVSGAPSLALSALRMRSQSTTLQIGGNVVATLTPPADGVYTFATGVPGQMLLLQGNARLTITGGLFEGNPEGLATPPQENIGTMFLVRDTAQLVLDGVTVRNVNGAGAFAGASLLGVAGSSAATPAQLVLRNGTQLSGMLRVAPFGFNVINAGDNALLTLDNARITGAQNQYAIVGAGANLTIQLLNGSVLSNNTKHLAFTAGAGSSLKIDHASITGVNDLNGGEFLVEGVGASSVDINFLSFGYTAPTPVGQAIRARLQAGSVKLRNSSFTGSGGYGLTIMYPGSGSQGIDLGTAASPGGNTFTGNTAANLQLFGQPAGTVASAAGNTWQAGQQGADANGNYAAGTVKTGPQSGTNFLIGSGTTLDF